jgi:hypothetical protein
MTGLNVARVAKLVALLGFVLPWVLVSCSGEPIGRLSGIDLATGGAGQSPHGQPNLWVVISLAAVIAGLVVSFLLRGRAAIFAVAAAALIALVTSAIGVSSLGSSAPAGAQRAAVGQIDLQYGYFITVAGLLVAIGACGMALSGRGGGSTNALARRDGP